MCTWTKAYWNLSNKFNSKLNRSVATAGKPITDIPSDFIYSQTVSLSLSLTSAVISTPLIHPQPDVMLNVIVFWNVKSLKESRNRPGVAQRVRGGLGSQISRHSAHEGGEVVSLTHRPPLPPGNVPGTRFH